MVIVFDGYAGGLFVIIAAAVTHSGCRSRRGRLEGWKETRENLPALTEVRGRRWRCLYEGVTCDAASLPFGMVGELRRKPRPVVLVVLLLFMGVGLLGLPG